MGSSPSTQEAAEKNQPSSPIQIKIHSVPDDFAPLEEQESERTKKKHNHVNVNNPFKALTSGPEDKSFDLECFICHTVRDADGFKLTKCTFNGSATDANQMADQIQDRIASQQNPFLQLIHYIDKPKHQQKSFFSMIKEAFRQHDSFSFYVDSFEESLADKLKAGKLKGQEFARLFDCIAKGMEILQEDKLYIGGLPIDRIFDVDTPCKQKVYKIKYGITYELNYNFYNRWLQEFKDSKIIDHESLLQSRPPPSILKSIKEGKKYHNVNHYKWDVFSFGLLLLQTVTELEILETIYENQELDVDVEYIQKLLPHIPRAFQEIVAQMLDPDDNRRPDWIQIGKYLDAKFKDQRIMCHETFNDFIYGADLQASLMLSEQIQMRGSEKKISHKFYLDMDVDKVLDNNFVPSDTEQPQFIPKPVQTSVIRDMDLEKSSVEKNKHLAIKNIQTNRVKKFKRPYNDEFLTFDKLRLENKLEAVNRLRNIEYVGFNQ